MDVGGRRILGKYLCLLTARVWFLLIRVATIWDEDEFTLTYTKPDFAFHRVIELLKLRLRKNYRRHSFPYISFCFPVESGLLKPFKTLI